MPRMQGSEKRPVDAGGWPDPWDPGEQRLRTGVENESASRCDRRELDRPRRLLFF
jgi:hypothetical protein